MLTVGYEWLWCLYWGDSDRSNNFSLNAVVVIQVIMVVVMITWTMVIVYGGSEDWSDGVWR